MPSLTSVFCSAVRRVSGLSNATSHASTYGLFFPSVADGEENMFHAVIVCRMTCL